MTVTLCIPRPPLTVDGRTLATPREPIRFRLRWTTQRSESSYGLGVLVSGDHLFDGAAYRHLRATVGAWIEADDLARVAGALGVPAAELAR